MNNPFLHEDSLALNAARMEHLDTLGIKWRGKKVLDAGCGIGLFSTWLLDKGCIVNAFDARRENLEMAEKLNRGRGLGIFQCNIENQEIISFNSFDIVFCYGLIYHLLDPRSAIEKLSRLNPEVFLIESIVCDYDKPLLVVEKENKKQSDQSLKGIAARPSPAYIENVLCDCGYSCEKISQPDHPDYKFDQLNDKAVRRNGHRTRMVFYGRKQTDDCPN